MPWAEAAALLAAAVAPPLIALSPASLPAVAPPPAASPDPEPAVLDAVIRRLRDRPWAERVIARAAGNGGGEIGPVGGDHVVRYDPAGPRALLEFGPIRAFAEPGRLIAWSVRDDRVYLERRFPDADLAATIRRALPPLASPSLVLAAEGRVRPFWILGDVREPPVRDLASAPIPGPPAGDAGEDRRLVGLEGAAGASVVGLVVDADAARLVRTDSTTLAGGRTFQLEFDLVPLDPGDPGAWAPDLAGRDRVEHFRSLRGPTPLLVGQRMDDLRLVPAEPADGAPPPSLPLFSVFVPDDEIPTPALRPLHAIVLLLVDAAQIDAAEGVGDGDGVGAGAGEGEEVAGRVAAAARELSRIRDELERQAVREGTAAPRFIIRAVAVAPAEGGRGDAAARTLAQRIDVRGQGPAEARLPTALWRSGASLLDRLAPEAAAVAVVVGWDRRIRGVARIDGADAGERAAGLEPALRASARLANEPD